jgi:hypothetical protein
MGVNEGTGKSFWEKPEGTTGMVVGVASALLLGWGLWHALPFIISLLSNTITAVALGVALFVMLFVLFDRRFWALLWYMYRSVMRLITSIFIEIDPIGILKNYVSDLEDQLSKMERQIANLRGQMRNMKDIIEMNKRKKDDALLMAKKANSREMQAQFKLQVRKAGRLEKSNMTLQELYNKMEITYKVLLKMKETCAIMKEDLADEVTVRIQEYKAIKAAEGAFSSAMMIIKGDKAKKEIFEMTMERLAEDTSQKIGEIEYLLDASTSFIESVDLQNGIFEEKGLQMLEEWEKKGDSLLFGDSKTELLTAGSVPLQIAEADIRIDDITDKSGDSGKSKTDEYAHIIRKEVK